MARLRRDAPATNPIDDLTALFQKATKDFTQTVEESTVLKEIKEKFNNISTVSIQYKNFSFIFGVVRETIDKSWKKKII